MIHELCRRCGGSGSNHNLINPGKCPACRGQGYVNVDLGLVEIQELRKEVRGLRGR